jgi:hypothetical protein
VILRIFHIVLLFSFSITIAHKTISHHHHPNEKTTQHSHKHEEKHSSFSFADLDDDFLQSKIHILCSAQGVCSGLQIKISTPVQQANLVITQQDHPPPDQLIRFSEFRGPPMV